MKNFLKLFKQLEVKFLLLTILFLVISSFYLNNSAFRKPDPFGQLAEQFLAGKTYFDAKFIELDLSLYNNKYYWPLGPFPAILLIPFKLLPWQIPSFLINFILSLLVLSSFYKLCRIHLEKTNALWVTMAFIFGSSYIGILTFGNYAHLTHNIIILTGILALIEYYKKKRWWLIGIFIAIMLATRITAAFVLIFFIASLLSQYINFNKESKKITIQKKDLFINIGLLILPIIITTIALGWYNYIRFDSVWEGGYNYQILTKEFLQESRDRGLFSFAMLPINLYYLLIHPPQLFTVNSSFVLQFPYFIPDPFGMGILFVSPYLFYLFYKKTSSKDSKFACLAIITTATPLLFFFSPGFLQFGNRYSLDYLLFIFLIFIITVKNHDLPPRYKLIILISSFINYYLIINFAYIRQFLMT